MLRIAGTLGRSACREADRIDVTDLLRDGALSGEMSSELLKARLETVA